MNSRIENIAGKIFGRLTVKEYHSSINRGALWVCACVCGKSVVIKAKNIKSGATKSCGCFHSEQASTACKKRLTTHGQTSGGNKRVYRIWVNMISRCKNEKFDSYPYYGGRGIIVCDRWLKFQNFLDDMGAPLEAQSIDRINSNGNYELENCKWATRLEQSNNKKNNVFIEAYGRMQTVAQWSRFTKIPAGTIAARKRRGWADDLCVTIGAEKGVIWSQE